MQLKDYFFYSLLVPAVGAIVYLTYNVGNVSAYLKKEYPECTKSNPNAIQLFLGTSVMIWALSYPVIAVAHSMYMKALPLDRYPHGSKVRAERADINAQKVFNLFMYVCSSLMLFGVLKHSSFLDTRLWGNNPEPRYMKDYPCMSLPNYLDDLYIVKMSYHVYDLMCTVLLHRDRRDFSEYILHHIITVSLILFSYSTNFIPFGAVIMLVHDIPDIFVALMKCVADIARNSIVFSVYVTMLSSWVYFRHYYFPCQILYTYYYECINNDHKA